MHVRAFSFLGLCARNSLTFAALRPGDGLGPRCQYYRSPSAPAWGATPLPRPSACRAKSFKPRTRVGCDTAKPPDGAVTVGFNPRTRVGCDQSRLRSLLRKSCFNPRTRVGCDQFIRQPRRAIAKFQSTHPRGVRPSECRHDGGRQNVSIHAPAWGATWTRSSHPDHQ